jgi:hypothetical protein
LSKLQRRAPSKNKPTDDRQKHPIDSLASPIADFFNSIGH